MRLSYELGHEFGPETVAFLGFLRDYLVSCSSGPSTKKIPVVSSDLSSSDLMSLAELVCVTYLAFLSPEEAAEQKTSIGFRSNG